MKLGPPLTACDAGTDRFLILDGSRRNYPPVWVGATDLFAAMNANDPDNEHKTRGFVLIRGDRQPSSRIMRGRIKNRL